MNERIRTNKQTNEWTNDNAKKANKQISYADTWINQVNEISYIRPDNSAEELMSALFCFCFSLKALTIFFSYFTTRCCKVWLTNFGSCCREKAIPKLIKLKLFCKTIFYAYLKNHFGSIWWKRGRQIVKLFPPTNSTQLNFTLFARFR
jgi:hypothetical protein